MPERDQRADDGEPGETKQERINRELIELLNELRVALPGVQFLFAFLLIVPFQQTIGQVTEFQRGVYYVALAAAAVATVLLIAPAAQHRVLFRQHDKEKLLQRGSRSAFAGLLVLAVAIVSALLLVVDFLFSLTLAWITAGALSALLLWWWVVVPFWQRAHNQQDDLDD
jgi:ABC-type bacteriocin/lantibiotic exporter with double-glycine peptidase domain